MKQNTQHIESLTSQAGLLKSYREHIDKESERLLQYFGDELKFSDPLRLMGWRYKQKDAEFDQLQRENQSLKMTNLRISEDLASFRKSVPDVPHQDAPKQSLLSTKKQPPAMESLTKTGTCLGSEDLVDRMKDIQAMKEQARESYADYKDKFDQLLEYLFRTLTQTCSNQLLVNEMKAGAQQDQERETVVVPKKRYEQLIRIYAINMAEITVAEMKQKLPLSDLAPVDSQINFMEQQKKQYKQNYSDLIKNPEIDVKDLSLFFKELSRKMGFSAEWERYQRKSLQQARVLKWSIDSILTRYQKKDAVSSVPVAESSPALAEEKFHLKLNALVKELAFNKGEKALWEKLYSRIREDKLIDFGQICDMIKENNAKREQSLVEQLSRFISLSLRRCCVKLQELLATRLKTPFIQMAEEKELLEQQRLAKELKNEVNSCPRDDYWEAVSKVFDQRLTATFNILESSLVFMSYTNIYRVLRKK